MVLWHGVEQNKDLNSFRFTKTLKGRCHGSGTTDSRVQGSEQLFWHFRFLHPLNVFAPGCSCCVQKQPYLSFNCFPFDSDARRYMNSGDYYYSRVSSFLKVTANHSNSRYVFPGFERGGCITSQSEDPVCVTWVVLVDDLAADHHRDHSVYYRGWSCSTCRWEEYSFNYYS